MKNLFKIGVDMKSLQSLAFYRLSTHEVSLARKMITFVPKRISRYKKVVVKPTVYKIIVIQPRNRSSIPPTIVKLVVFTDFTDFTDRLPIRSMAIEIIRPNLETNRFFLPMGDKLLNFLYQRAYFYGNSREEFDEAMSHDIYLNRTLGFQLVPVDSPITTNAEVYVHTNGSKIETYFSL